MIAALGMYDFGPAMAANDRFWALIRDGLRSRGLSAPDELTRGEAAYWPAWQSPDLMLSQTCGYPFRARLHGKVSYVGTPNYGVEGCPPGHYCSVYVARKDDARTALDAFDGASFAYNDALSQSGWAGPQTHATALGVRLLPAFATGGHGRSAAAVAEGRADLTALDAVTWALMQDIDPVVGALKVVGTTGPTPGLPYISALGLDAATIFASLCDAVGALSAEDRASLRLKGIVAIPDAAYLAVPSPPSPDEMRLAI